MSFDLVIENVRLGGEDGPRDLGIRSGRIAAMAPKLPGTGQRFDGCGCFAFGGYVESHIHLDKACILDRCEICDGTLAEAVRETARAKSGFTEDDVYARARSVVEKAISFGTTRMRSFVEIDPRAGFRSFAALTRIVRDYAWALDLQLCAFAQEGLTQEPATLDMLDEALGSGAQLVGGCPYTDPDPETHINQIFDLAEKHGCAVDFHIDFDLNPEGSNLDAVIRETVKRGFQGRVSLGHVTKLSAMPPDRVTPIADRLAEAGISLTVLPATDMFLLGRDRDHLVPRGLAPALLLASRGVNVTVATNNVLNPFTPFGDASLGRMSHLFANIAQLSRNTDLDLAFEMVSSNAARLMNADYGLIVGGPADLVLLDAPDARAAIRQASVPLAGFKAGRQTFSRPRPELHFPVSPDQR